MTERFVAVLAPRGSAGAAPPGVDPGKFRLALLEDTYELASDMGRVTAALAIRPDDHPTAEAVTWPGTPLVRLSPDRRAGDTADTGDAGEAGDTRESADEVVAALAGLADLGADEGVVLAGDAPDLPIMLLGKLFQGLEHAEAAACPAEGGGLVGLGARLPVAGWLAEAQVDLDTGDALARLRHAAPSRRALSVTPGWRRLRQPGDIANLDPGLEGWEVTRALLSGRHHS